MNIFDKYNTLFFSSFVADFLTRLSLTYIQNEIKIQDSNKTNVYELGGETVADSAQVTFGVKPTVQEAAVVLIKDVKNARPGPSIYRVSSVPPTPSFLYICPGDQFTLDFIRIL